VFMVMINRFQQSDGAEELCVYLKTEEKTGDNGKYKIRSSQKNGMRRIKLDQGLTEITELARAICLKLHSKYYPKRI